MTKNLVKLAVEALSNGTSRVALMPLGIRYTDIKTIQTNYRTCNLRQFDDMVSAIHKVGLVDLIRSAKMEGSDDKAENSRFSVFKADHPEFAEVKGAKFDYEAVLQAYALTVDEFDYLHARNYFRKLYGDEKKIRKRARVLIHLLNAIRVGLPKPERQYSSDEDPDPDW